MADLSLFDYIILVVVGLSLISGFVRGFATMALSLIAWVGAVLVTIYGFGFATQYVRPLIDQKEVADIVTFAGLFIVSLILFRLFANLVGSGIRTSAIGFLDRSAGALAGLFVGILSISVLYLLLGLVISRPSQPDWIRQAKLQPILA